MVVYIFSARTYIIAEGANGAPKFLSDQVVDLGQKFIHCLHGQYLCSIFYK